MATSANQTSGLLNEARMVFGQGDAMRSFNAIVADVAPTDIPVLLIGESGTGKEVYARLIHRLSRYSNGRLRKLMCRTADPGVLLTKVYQAFQQNPEEGGAGTVFLDGIEELDLASQRVILSLLPDEEPNGSADGTPARLISASSRDLEGEVARGQFRRELYFRINGVCLRLPPLRERKEDIPVLAQYFLNKQAGELKREAPVLDSEALELLKAYDWPGNIRELENVTKKMVALGDAVMVIRDLRAAPLKHPQPNDGQNFSALKIAARAASRHAEREMILQALERTHWNRKRAARELQISYKSLLYKIKQIGVQTEETKGA